MKYKEIIEIILLAIIVFLISIIFSNFFWLSNRLDKIDKKTTNTNIKIIDIDKKTTNVDKKITDADKKITDVQKTLDKWFIIVVQ